MSEEGLAHTYDTVIEFAREKHGKVIDDAYDFFWEEDDPADMLMGHALELGFINFEDWLVCDYIPTDGSKGLIDRYIESEQPGEEIKSTLISMRDSFLSLYEVVESGDPVRLRDIALGSDPFEISGDKLSDLEKGYVFAARFMEIGDSMEMGRSVYPFGASMKETITDLLTRQFERYHKNKNPEGGMEEFLRDESYTFNITWMSCLFRPKK
jgi:hypothetical protein